MKILIHHTTNKTVFEQFNDSCKLNHESNQMLYNQCSRYIDGEVLELNYLFILIIAYYNTESKERKYKFFELSRLGKHILVNTIRKEMEELIVDNIDEKDLENYSYGYYQVIENND